MAQANDWVINVREIAAADGKTNGTKQSMGPCHPSNSHISHLLFLKINVFNDIGFVCFGLALKAVGDNYDKKFSCGPWPKTEDW